MFSEKDFLTSLYNRRFVDNFVPKILKKASSKTKKVSLLVIDVNHFKKLNDTFGHYKGDMALKKIAECLKKNIRSSDIVARWGGDEFLIIAPDMDKISAEAFSKEIERTFFNEMGEEFKNIIDLSIGQATFPDDAQTFDELLSLADNNMYTVKYRKRLKL
ncbi:GGDEF domain-containing protein [Heyndrickxia ginsengihumi]|uniref:GGDEF domain-containing protein n=1 Tax=Heyndrickxia ginsengihumi TaxID=363870 RepID=UPI0009DC99E3|nr:GGDEF domain-containing protein [Heyndrickxia ginsengihumi]